MRKTLRALAVLSLLVIEGCSNQSPTGGVGTSGGANATPVTSSGPQVGASAVASDASVCGQIPAGGETQPIPWGEYSTGPIAVPDLVKELEAKGLKDSKAMFESHGYTVASGQTEEIIFCFVDGEWAQYWRPNGGQPSIGSNGTYRITSPGRLELREQGVGVTPVTFKLDGNRLLFTDVTPLQADPDPWGSYVRAMFAAVPYTRVTP